MLLRKAEVARVVRCYLRERISQEDEAAVIKAAIGEAEIAIMEIIRRQVEMAVSQ